MNTQQVARAILNRRTSMSPIITSGEIIASIGADHMQEALQRRWLVPNGETGYLQVSTDMNRVQEMRDLAEKCDKCKHAECACVESLPTNESRNAVMGHAGVKTTIYELLSPGTGHDSGSPLSGNSGGLPPQQPQQAPTSSTPVANAKPAIGDEVMVAEDGKTFMGRVSSLSGGRYRLSFGGEKPKTTRDYTENEVRMTQKVGAAGH